MGQWLGQSKGIGPSRCGAAEVVERGRSEGPFDQTGALIGLVYLV